MAQIAAPDRTTHSVMTADVQRGSNSSFGGPGIFWLGGLRSSRNGQKATAVARWSEASSLDCIRFDYRGHGDSPHRFETCTVSDWLSDARAVYAAHARAPQILVGSSLGGWIACLMAMAMGDEGTRPPVAGLVLIAPAIDMTERLIWQSMSDADRCKLMETGTICRPSRYGDGDYRITQALIEDGRRHLLGTRPLDISCPVRILHGALDPDVPLAVSRDLCACLAGTDVSLTVIPDGDHRLSRPQDIALLTDAIGKMSGQLSVSPDAQMAPIPSR